MALTGVGGHALWGADTQEGASPQVGAEGERECGAHLSDAGDAMVDPSGRVGSRAPVQAQHPSSIPSSSQLPR